jgi:hypothetical protein
MKTNLIESCCDKCEKEKINFTEGIENLFIAFNML